MNKNSRTSVILGLLFSASLLFLSMPGCSGGTAGTSGECSTNDSCDEGMVCVDSECRQVCLSNTDCDSGFYCEEGTCAGEAAVCGNGIVERGETCDNNCPISCSDDSACTRNEMTGSADTCDISCAFPPVDVCMGGDGCCPAMCSFANDSDCSDSCGDNIVDDDETCDGNCPTAADCVDTNACTADAILGSANNCSAECINTDIMLCIGGDGCCPGSCNQANDTDCIPNCGNSIVEDGEICDGDCPSYCSDTDVCTSDVLIGSSDDCDVECTHTDITDCSAGDGCCPSDCNAANDADCAATCGNDVIESGELCDGDCPETCSGADACMSYTLEGSECSRECVSAPVAGCPSLEMLYNGEAHFVRDAQGLGAGFNMHFLSIVEEADALSAYYINGYTLDGVTRYATGLATSTDGLSFQDQGIVLDIGGSWERNFDAVTDLSHLVGRADSGDWSANTIDDSAGFLAYGPYQTGWSGSNVASFQLMVDFNADHVHALSIQVYNSTDDVMLASQDIYRDDFTATMTYQIFNLGFTADPAKTLEFRVYWRGNTYTRISNIATAQGQSPFFDDRIASFSSVLKRAGAYTLVYEGAGTSSTYMGDVGLATSADGITFSRSPSSPFLSHYSTGWESVNIGTPSLYEEGGVFYLFYHGFDGIDVQVGVATFSSGAAPQKYVGNPILTTSASGWDSGTVGKRSQILKEGSYYYMAYEGSTDQPYDSAQWSTGVARSQDLYTWTKSTINPMVPVTSNIFGNDGPEMILLDGDYYLYIRVGGNVTDRYVLQAN